MWDGCIQKETPGKQIATTLASANSSSTLPTQLLPSQAHYCTITLNAFLLL